VGLAPPRAYLAELCSRGAEPAQQERSKIFGDLNLQVAELGITECDQPRIS